MIMSKKVLLAVWFMCVASIGSQVEAQTGDIDPLSNVASQKTCINITNDLRITSRDAQTSGQVSDLQFFLQSKGYLSAEPTGYFGMLTQAAVSSFQANNSIFPSTGFVGVNTRNAINSQSCSNNASTGTSNQSSLVATGGIFEEVAVPTYDLNDYIYDDKGPVILYRYKITAPKEFDVILKNETIYISRSGVSMEPVTMKVFSKKTFKKLIQSKVLTGTAINNATESIVYNFQPEIRIKAGKTVYVQVETTIGGSKDVASITTGHKGLGDVTLKTGSNSAPAVSLVANPSSIISDGKPGTVELSWSSAGASYCNFEKSRLSTSGSMKVLVPQTSTYAIACTGPGGTVTSNSVTVPFRTSQQSVKPTISYVQAKAGDMNTIYLGEQFTIYGSSFIDSKGNDPQVYVGGVRTYPDRVYVGQIILQAPYASKDYINIYVKNSDGTSNTVNVRAIEPAIAAPTCSLTANKSSYKLGETIIYSWTSDNATYAGWQQDTSGRDNLWLPGDKMWANDTSEVTANVIGNPTVTLLIGGYGGTSTCSKTVNITN
jgi:peptidoglycan hydrolase-like protein with peptidoglycan-binding domain